MNDQSFESLLSAALALAWQSPPDEVQAAVSRLPDFDPAPSLGSSARAESWMPADVRGSTLFTSASPSLQVHSFSWADVSLLIVPPEGDDLWRLEGRFWLHEPSDVEILVLLAAGDHVMATTRICDGQHFELLEALGQDWSLEFHVPGHAPLSIGAPRR